MFSGTSKLGSWIDVANAFNDLFASNINTNSYETRIPDDSQSLIFFNDFCGSFSDSDILQVILNSTACTYENRNMEVLSSFQPNHKGACRNDITNYRPISLKISLIFEKLLHKFLIDLLKNKIYPRQYGFQSKKSTICQLLEYVQLPVSQQGRPTILNILR